MWQKFAEFTKSLININETLQQNKSDIKELQREVRQLSLAIQLIGQEMQHSREREASEREKMALRLEVSLLKMRQLPAPKNDEME